jgi:hypothetical protein
LNEAAAIHAAVLHLVDHGTQFVIQHGSPRPVRASSRRAAGVRRVWFWQMAIDGTPNALNVNVWPATIRIKQRGF